MTILEPLNHNGPFQKKTPVPSTFLVLPSCSASLLRLDPYGHRALLLSTEREAESYHCCPKLPSLLFFSLHCVCFVYLVLALHPSLFLVSTSWFVPNNGIFTTILPFNSPAVGPAPTHRQWISLLLATLISNSECSPEKTTLQIV